MTDATGTGPASTDPYNGELGADADLDPNAKDGEQQSPEYEELDESLLDGLPQGTRSDDPAPAP